MKKRTFLIFTSLVILIALIVFDQLNSHSNIANGHQPIAWCLAAFLVTKISWFKIGQSPNRFRLRLIPTAAVLAMIYLQIVTSTGSFSLLGLSEKDLTPALGMAGFAFLAGFIYVTAKDECKETPTSAVS